MKASKVSWLVCLSTADRMLLEIYHEEPVEAAQVEHKRLALQRDIAN